MCVFKFVSPPVLVMSPARDGFTVSEGDCDVELCLIKNMDTAEAITVNVFLVELPFEGNSATGIGSKA